MNIDQRFSVSQINALPVSALKDRLKELRFEIENALFAELDQLNLSAKAETQAVDGEYLRSKRQFDVFEGVCQKAVSKLQAQGHALAHLETDINTGFVGSVIYCWNSRKSSRGLSLEIRSDKVIVEWTEDSN